MSTRKTKTLRRKDKTEWIPLLFKGPLQELEIKQEALLQLVLSRYRT